MSTLRSIEAIRAAEEALAAKEAKLAENERKRKEKAERDRKEKADYAKRKAAVAEAKSALRGALVTEILGDISEAELRAILREAKAKREQATVSEAVPA